MPAGTLLTVQRLIATAGNGCVVLAWNDRPEGSILGFNVYREVNGEPVLLTGTPITYSMYGDTGLTNGQLYSYQVRTVSLEGTETSTARVHATPIARAPSATWIDPPSSPAMGRLWFEVARPKGNRCDLELLVDGRRLFSMEEYPERQRGALTGSLDTITLSNGAHVFQAVGNIDGVGCATCPLTLETCSILSLVDYDSLLVYDPPLVPNVKHVAQAHLSAPPDYTLWTVRVLNERGATLRSWRGTSRDIRVGWDGTDASGVILNTGLYKLLVDVSNGSERFGTSVDISLDNNLR